MHLDNVNAFSGVLQTRLALVRTSDVKIKVTCLIFWMKRLILWRSYQFSEAIEHQLLVDFGNNWCGIWVGALW